MLSYKNILGTEIHPYFHLTTAYAITLYTMIMCIYYKGWNSNQL